MLLGALLAAMAPGCGADESDDDGDDEQDVDAQIDSSEAAIAVPGGWKPSAGAVRAASAARFAYDSASGPCSGRLLPGADALGDAVAARFRRNIASPGGGMPAVQGYNCRSIRGGGGRSIHGTGRALDIFIPRIRGKADNTKGDAVANWLLENASQLGVQAIIWDRAAWSVRSKRVGRYTGQHPHDDHVHVEITEEAAAKQLAWYRGR